MDANFAEAVHGIPQFIIERQLDHFDKAGARCGTLVRAELAGLDKQAHGAQARVAGMQKA